MKLKKIFDFRPLYFLWAILILGFVLYFPSTQFSFLLNFDDDTLILNSPEILQFSWENILYIFTHTKDGLYHPITSLTWQIEHALFGLDPFYYHLDNILLHLLCVFLFYQLLKSWFEDYKIAFIGSALFLIHPMHVENIAWISARKDLVVAVFFLLSLIYHSEYLKDNTKRNQVAFIGFFILALFSKASAMVLPGLFFLVDWFRGNRNWKQLIRRQIPLLVLSILALALTVYAQKSAGFIGESGSQFSLLDRFFMLFYSLSYYLVRFCIPFDLSPKNVYPSVESGTLPLVYYFSLLVPLGIALLIYSFKKHRSILLFGFGFLLLAIFPLLKIIPTGNDIVSNRYAYMAYFGLYGLAAYFFVHVKFKVKYGLLAAVFISFSFQSFRYQKTYSDSLSVWSEVIQSTDENSWEQAMGLNERGQVYLKAGNQQLALQDINAALKIEPTLFRALLNRSSIYELNNQLDLALADLNLALQHNHKASDALRIRGALYGKMNQAELAIADFNVAISITPKQAELYNNRGIAYSILGKTIEAESDFKEAIRLNPYYYEAMLNRANLFLDLAKYESAEADLNYILKANPKQLNASYLLAKIYLVQNQKAKAEKALSPYRTNEIQASEIAALLSSDGFYEESLAYFGIALGSDQIREKTLYQRATAFRKLGRYQDAIDDLMAILEKMPNPQFFFEIGSLYKALNKNEKACEFWKEAADRDHAGSRKRLEQFCTKN